MGLELSMYVMDGTTLNANVIVGSYDYKLVALSLIIATLASYATLELIARLIHARGSAKAVWLTAGSFTMGAGIWCMHYVGMQAFRAPIDIVYDWPTALLSFLVAVSGSAAALFVLGTETMNGAALTSGSVILGLAIASMHYIGVAAMRFPGAVEYTYAVVVLSIVIAIGITFVAFKLALSSRQRLGAWIWSKLLAAVLLGMTIPLIHYCGMAAVTFRAALLLPMLDARAIPISRVSADGLSLITVFLFALILLMTRASRGRVSGWLQSAESKERYSSTLAQDAERVIQPGHHAPDDELQERKELQAQLNYLKFHDTHTGLWNREYLFGQLLAAQQLAQTPSSFKSTLIYLDLDKFKQINDVFGHRIGDLILTEISRRLTTCAGSDDILARMGGDKFALLFHPTSSPAQSLRMAHRILNVVEEPVLLEGLVLPLTATAGLCEITARHSTPEDILHDAETAMYLAKRESGTRCLTFEPSMDEGELIARQTRHDLTAAIEQEQFELFYQPLVDMQTLTIYGVEALVRWNHPKRGFLPPGAFIKLAEETGVIVALGSWCLQKACLDHKAFVATTGSDLVLSVNVSGKQLERGSFLSDLKLIISVSGIAPRLLQLEITEGIFLSDTQRLGVLLAEIRALGIKIALDDFGTGYSSLSYLQRYPIDTLKIDQSFVQRIGSGPVSADILKTIINLGAAIGVATCAEGVEEPIQALTLFEYGCTHAQGYLYARPVQYAAFLSLLKDGLDPTGTLAISLRQETEVK